jgi:hypothetical protein
MLYDAFNRRIRKPQRYVGFAHTATREPSRLDPEKSGSGCDAIGFEYYPPAEDRLEEEEEPPNVF